MKALVTGASGFIGSHLCDLLLEQGYSVRAMVRRTSNRRWLDGRPLELVTGDLSDSDSLARACAGMELVFHAGAAVMPKDKSEFERVNHEGTRSLAQAAEQAGVRRLVMFSSIAAVGPAAALDQPLTEGCAPRPVSRYGRGKLKAEQALTALKDRLHSVILRLPVVYGPRDREVLLLWKQVAKGFLAVPECVSSLVYVADATRAALLAAEAEVASASVYFVSDGSCHTCDELCRAAERVLDRKVRRVKVPRWLVRLAGRLNEWLSREGSMLNSDKARELACPYWVCSPGRAKVELGFEPEFELERGLRLTLDWYRQEGWL
ncbi:MAG: NAD-dependent epimerase/dehydratase family protein [candidate division WOR-3 bacterium]